MPLLTLEVLPPFVAGFVLAAPMAATMSTVNALLILVSSTVVKDIYLNYIKPEASETSIKRVSFWTTSIIGLAVVLFAMNPPSLIVWLNLFAFGGLEAAFVWSVVFGLYWKGANKYGALASMVVGMTSYIAISIWWPHVFGMHSVTLPIVFSLLAFLIMSMATRRRVQPFVLFD